MFEKNRWLLLVVHPRDWLSAQSRAAKNKSPEEDFPFNFLLQMP
jgi:hypothetical protein